jgi:type III pantothenate kinase
MLLAIDAGNTNVVLGIFEKDECLATMRIATRRDATADEISLVVGHLARRIEGGAARITRTVVCSVVPSLTRSFEAFAREELGHEPLIVNGQCDLGVPVRLDDPREIGADRIVNALAAKHAFGTPVVVVDLGTATTFDCVDASGAYIGGIIVPGVETSAEELFRRAARLTKVDLTFPPVVIGRNTRDSLRSGILRGTVGMIDALVAQIWEEIGKKGTAVATGGLAPLIGPHCRSIDQVDVNLTLQGLLLVDRIGRKKA